MVDTYMYAYDNNQQLKNLNICITYMYLNERKYSLFQIVADISNIAAVLLQCILSIFPASVHQFYAYKLVKFRLFEKHSKFEKIFLMVLTNQLIYLVNVKTIRKIFSNYVCFSKSLNFN